ncbi:hypothetical protein [Archangium lipolyticum]|uniref:hypothetical protein n=1 Tax=Archangium lipolyticum TaxID=2970465 RepID=UPI00214A1448|nr:hypothetical protein [Archangium lipolyticum]
MRTMTQPDTMNPKQHHNPAGLANVRVSALPAPSSQWRYRRHPLMKRGFRGCFDWRPHPGLFF